MRIHYRKDLNNPDKIIYDVLYIQVIDGNSPVSVVLRNGKELTIRLDRIEGILDDELCEPIKIRRKETEDDIRNGQSNVTVD